MAASLPGSCSIYGRITTAQRSTSIGPASRPTNCYVETFTRSYRDECLNVHWFETVDEAQEISEAWRRDYNETRPHMTLKDATPEEFVRQNGGKNAEN